MVMVAVVRITDGSKVDTDLLAIGVTSSLKCRISSVNEQRMFNVILDHRSLYPDSFVLGVLSTPLLTEERRIEQEFLRSSPDPDPDFNLDFDLILISVVLVRIGGRGVIYQQHFSNSTALSLVAHI